MNNLGNIIKELRISKGLSQPALAKLLEVSNGIISLWEAGKTEPKASYIVRMANVFGVATDYLLGLENEDYTPAQTISSGITSDEVEILDLYRSLNSDGKEIAKSYLENLQEINAIKKIIS